MAQMFLYLLSSTNIFHSLWKSTFRPFFSTVGDRAGMQSDRLQPEQWLVRTGSLWSGRALCALANVEFDTLIMQMTAHTLKQQQEETRFPMASLSNKVQASEVSPSAQPTFLFLPCELSGAQFTPGPFLQHRTCKNLCISRAVIAPPDPMSSGKQIHR